MSRGRVAPLVCQFTISSQWFLVVLTTGGDTLHGVQIELGQAMTMSGVVLGSMVLPGAVLVRGFEVTFPENITQHLEFIRSG